MAGKQDVDFVITGVFELFGSPSPSNGLMGALRHQKDAKGENSTRLGRQPWWGTEKELGLPYLTGGFSALA